MAKLITLITLIPYFINYHLLFINCLVTFLFTSILSSPLIYFLHYHFFPHYFHDLMVNRTNFTSYFILVVISYCIILAFLSSLSGIKFLIRSNLFIQNYHYQEG